LRIQRRLQRRHYRMVELLSAAFERDATVASQRSWTIVSVRIIL